ALRAVRHRNRVLPGARAEAGLPVRIGDAGRAVVRRVVDGVGGAGEDLVAAGGDRVAVGVDRAVHPADGDDGVLAVGRFVVGRGGAGGGGLERRDEEALAGVDDQVAAERLDL